MKGYRTLIVNGAVAVLPLVDMLINNSQLVGAALGANGAAALSVLALVNLVLRWVTTTPILRAE